MQTYVVKRGTGACQVALQGENNLRQTLRGSLPGAERVNAALGGVVAAPRVKRSSGCTEGTMRANLPS